MSLLFFIHEVHEVGLLMHLLMFCISCACYIQTRSVRFARHLVFRNKRRLLVGRVADSKPACSEFDSRTAHQEFIRALATLS